MYLGDEGDDLVKSCRTKVKFYHFAHSFKPSICADYALYPAIVPHLWKHQQVQKQDLFFKKRFNTVNTEPWI